MSACLSCSLDSIQMHTLIHTHAQQTSGRVHCAQRGRSLRNNTTLSSDGFHRVQHALRGRARLARDEHTDLTASECCYRVHELLSEDTHLPNTVCLLSSQLHGTVVMKNCTTRKSKQTPTVSRMLPASMSVPTHSTPVLKACVSCIRMCTG